MRATTGLTTGEVISFSVLVGLGVLLALAFLAYGIHHARGSTTDVQTVANAGIFTLGAQILIALIFGYALVLLMESKVITSEAGLPALTGLTGFVVGKSASGAGTVLPPRKPPPSNPD